MKKRGFRIIIFTLIFLFLGNSVQAIEYRGFLDPLAREFYKEGKIEEILGRLLAKEEEISSGTKGAHHFLSLAEIEMFRGEIKVTAGLGKPEKHFEKALELAGMSLELEETSLGNRLAAEALSQLFNYRGTFFIIRNGNRALNFLETALEMGEDFYMTQFVRANYLINAPRIGGGNQEEGINIFEEILAEGHPVFDFLILHIKAGLARQDKEEEKAEEYLRQAGEIFPESPWVGKFF